MSAYNAADWKPGDVALVNGTVCLRVGNSWEHGDQRAFKWEDHETLDARRLAVIDTADWSLMLSLVQTMNIHQPGDVITKTAERLQAALREFASPTPLKPPEPQGQGAIVEDAQGVRWVRVEPTNPDITAWVAAWTGTVDNPQPADYDDISAVRVLSEGIQ